LINIIRTLIRKNSSYVRTYVRTYSIALLILIAMAGYVHGAAKASFPERLHEELLPLDLDVGVVLAEVETRAEVPFAGAAHLQAILVRKPTEPAVV